MTPSRSWIRAINSDSSGMTLIELIIVIGIMGGLLNLVAIRANALVHKARDNTRLGQMNSLYTAIMLYYADHGHYPYDPNDPSADSGPLLGFTAVSDANFAYPVSPSNYVPHVAPQYVKSLPRDPNPGLAYNNAWPNCQILGYSRTMVYLTTGTDFKLLDHCAMETPIIAQNLFADNPTRCNASGCWAWGIWSSPESQGW
jgi:prepilin-type N-terminal cleavage/methylation domain-containing protein